MIIKAIKQWPKTALVVLGCLCPLSAQEADTINPSPADTAATVSLPVNGAVAQTQSQGAYIELNVDELKRVLELHEKKEPHGGAGGPAIQLMWMDMTPIEKLVQKEASLAGRVFNFENSPMVLWGGLGYGGGMENVRFGGGGWGGVQQFYSDHFAGNDSVAGQPVDSLVELTVIPAFGGLMIEKGFKYDHLNLLVGGMLGGGALVVAKSTLAAEDQSAFSTTMNDSIGSSLRGQLAVAPCMVATLQAGATYSLLSWLHVGADGGAAFWYSKRGFGYGFGSISTVNPFVRLRIMFGNLG
jgi:hypothetical protein